MDNGMPETFYDKIVRKTKEDPLVPVGIGITVLFLTMGFRSFYRGNKQQAQFMMRGRVVAQAFTVSAMALSALYGLKPHSRPESAEAQLDSFRQNKEEYANKYQKPQ